MAASAAAAALKALKAAYQAAARISESLNAALALCA